MTADSWIHLKAYTAARIALGRAGASLPTSERLHFQFALARARDAVLSPFNPGDLVSQFADLPLRAMVLASGAADRATHLQRPDLGRKLSPESTQELAGVKEARPWDLAILISDGLSTLAALRQTRPLLGFLLPPLLDAGWRVAPLFVVPNGRVALQDEVGGILNATLSLMLLGERPGLGSPDSLGAYFTFQPGPGKTDADRNCVSNIRPEGLPASAAAEKLFYLLTQSRRQQLSGVRLKDDFILPAMGGAAGRLFCQRSNGGKY